MNAPLTVLNEDRVYGPSTIFHSGLVAQEADGLAWAAR